MNMDRIVKTESRGTGRGEQTNGRVSQIAAVEAGRAPVKLGDKRMKRANPTNEIDGQIVRAEQIRPDDDESNVLEFSAKLRELKKQVDPELVKQREVSRD